MGGKRSLPFTKNEVVGAVLVWEPASIGQYPARLLLDTTIQRDNKHRRYLCELNISRIAKDILTLFKIYYYDKEDNELVMMPAAGTWTEHLLEMILGAVRECWEADEP